MILGNGNANLAHNNYTLTQKDFNKKTGLTYFGSRHYDPQTTSWLTQDRYRRGDTQDLRSLQRYLYNNNSPVNYVDWYGYCSDPVLTSEGCPFWIPDWGWRGGSYTLGATYQFTNDFLINAPYYLDDKFNEYVLGNETAGVDRIQNPDFQSGRLKGNEYAQVYGLGEAAAGTVGVAIGTEITTGSGGMCVVTAGGGCVVAAGSAVGTGLAAGVAAHGSAMALCATGNQSKIAEAAEQARINNNLILQNKDKWYKSTFADEASSIRYHWNEHGIKFGKNIQQYTDDAQRFFEQNKHLGQKVTLRDGTEGIKLEVGQVGGYFKPDGRVVSFWYD
jgi:RHS repeat-associated protein